MNRFKDWLIPLISLLITACTVAYYTVFDKAVSRMRIEVLDEKAKRLEAEIKRVEDGAVNVKIFHLVVSDIKEDVAELKKDVDQLKNRAYEKK